MVQVHRPVSEGVLIVDYGSQYTLLIARRLREIGVYSEITESYDPVCPEGFKPFGYILSGGPDSVLEDGARSLPDWIINDDLPILGICYGMQLLVNHFGGELHQGRAREYGKANLHIQKNSAIFANKFLNEAPEVQQVWMSHGDHVESPPEGFEVLGLSDAGIISAIAHKERPIFGLQFHPEVQHSTYGANLLEGFAVHCSGHKKNWEVDCMVDSTLKSVKDSVNQGHVLVACSGGVDSSVAALLIAKALGPEKVTAVFVDTGLLRKNEGKWVGEKLKALGVPLHTLDKKDLFYSKLKGKSDPEDKRKTIGYTFIECFEAFAKGKNFTHLGQGTLYPDVIESAGHGSGAKVIKSHHNVGGLPEKLALDLLEPFRFLFKDEVRKIGSELGLPDELVQRHPFPGPGLAVRIPGEICEDKVKILQEADDIFIRALQDEGLYLTTWQAFAILLPVKAVGVMGDNRTYQWSCVLRAVSATDGMTAEVTTLPYDFLTRVSTKIVQQVDGINRVLYDITSKPPGTIEWE